MSKQNEYELIDRHLAGVLTPEEVGRLEQLIRDDPEWARRYREAEELSRLMRKAIVGPDGGRAPESVHRAVHRALETREPVSMSAFQARRGWLAAAVVLCLLGAAYLFNATRDTDLIPVAYTAEPMAVKDLARSSDVLMVGRIEEKDGQTRFHLENSIFGSRGNRACALPDGLEPGQRVALFGQFLGDDMIVVVGNDRGVVHLDGVQQWAGETLQPEETRRLLDATVDMRTSASALEDLEAFLSSNASMEGVGAADGRAFSAPVTARYLGRFPLEETHEILMRLLGNRAKHPEARAAGAHALIDADPARSCQELLTKMLSYPLERMHGESEDGFVMMHCLNEFRARGGSDLASDLRTFVARVFCPSLKRHGEAALRAVEGGGGRGVAPAESAVARRITVNGSEAVVLPGCQGKRLGLLVLFRGAIEADALNGAVNRAIGQGMGVVLLPPGERDVEAWLLAVAKTKLVALEPATYLGVGTGSEDAIVAARARAPSRLVLLGTTTRALTQLREGPAIASVEPWTLKGEGAEEHVLEAKTLDEALGADATWEQLLPKR